MSGRASDAARAIARHVERTGAVSVGALAREFERRRWDPGEFIRALHEALDRGLLTADATDWRIGR